MTSKNDAIYGDIDVLDLLIQKDKDQLTIEKSRCIHFRRGIRLVRIVKYLSKKNNYFCRNCKSEESVWICLYCANIGCGRNEKGHAQSHYKTDRAHHCIAVTVVDGDLSFWCYMCDDSLVPTSDIPLLWECRNALGKALKITLKEKDSLEKKEIGIVKESSDGKITGLIEFNRVIEEYYANFGHNSLVFSFARALKDLNERNLVLKREGLDKTKTVSFNPSELFGVISRKWRVYKQLCQQDSHELLVRVLDEMDTESKAIMSDKSSLIKTVFGGELASLIICENCGTISTSKEEFFVISLSIPLSNGKYRQENDMDELQSRMRLMNINDETVRNVLKTIEIPDSESRPSLMECLNKFMEVEILDGENQRRCEECCKNSDEKEPLSDRTAGISFKRYLFSSMPKILVFHLKRFQLLGLFKTRKIDTYVDFEEYIDTRQYLIPKMPQSSAHESTKYQLFGLVVHGGSLTGGHYISYVRQNDFNSWYYCSDSHTHAVSWNQVKKCQAYILFYRNI